MGLMYPSGPAADDLVRELVAGARLLRRARLTAVAVLAGAAGLGDRLSWIFSAGLPIVSRQATCGGQRPRRP